MKEAILLSPPKNTKPPSNATTTPVIYGDILKAFCTASPIEFACTPLPINPKASIQESEKNTARTLAKTPLLNNSSI